MINAGKWYKKVELKKKTMASILEKIKLMAKILFIVEEKKETKEKNPHKLRLNVKTQCYAITHKLLCYQWDRRSESWTLFFSFCEMQQIDTN